MKCNDCKEDPNCTPICKHQFAIQGRNTVEYTKIGQNYGYIECNIDRPLGLMYLIELIAQKLAEQTRHKVHIYNCKTKV